MARGLGVASLAAVLALAVSSVAPAAQPLRTGFTDVLVPKDSYETGLRRMRAGGATVVRTEISWAAIAPRAPAAPADPADPAYRWDAFDERLRALREHDLEPIVGLNTAPAWARTGSRAASPPRPQELALFMRAATERYSGRTHGVPAVRYWQLWNEPNLGLFLFPQFRGRTPVSPTTYRRMLDVFADAVHGAHPANLVIAGGTAPFRDLTPETLAVHKRWGPLTFMRELLCLSRSLAPKCRQRAKFDVWAHHPYTSGGPTHEAVLPDDVSLGDLPEMRRVLQAGIRAGNVVSKRAIQFWVTEFSWDSSPPDPAAVPTRLHTRWVAEGLYRMWRNGVTLVTWLQLRDEPPATSIYQSGLYYRGTSFETARPKPALRAFRFPLVAFPERGGRVHAWGRTPAGKPGLVVIEQSFRGGWKRLGVVATATNGIFERRFRSGPSGYVRARLADGTDAAVPFSLKAPPDRFFNPFGLPRLLEPRNP